MLDILLWSGIALTFVGAVLSFSARRWPPALFEALGLTLAGTAFFLRSLTPHDVGYGTACYATALLAIIGTAYFERREKKRAR